MKGSEFLHFKKRLLTKIFALTIAFILSLGCLSGCRGSDSGKSTSWLLSSTPKNLDPQTAKSESELIIIKNCFTGLFEKSSGGELLSSVSTQFDVSPNGLRYVFHLSEECFWSRYDNGKLKKYAPVTAHDFVFAIQRLFTDNPNASIMNILSDIKNADKVLAGENVTKLSVFADGDYKLVIDLKEKNPALPEAFTDPLLFPCNKEFFNETAGKYGLSADSLLFNGAFALKSWSESLIKLSKNPNSDVKPQIDSVTLYLPKATREHTNLLKEGDIDAALLSNEQFSSINSGSFSVSSRPSAIWVMVFNPQSALWNQNLKDSVAKCTDRSVLEKEGSHLSPINALVSDSAVLFSENYRALAKNVSSPAFNPQSALESFKNGLLEAQVSDLYSAEILVPKEEFGDEFAALNQIYQRELSLYFTPTYMQSSSILQKVKSGDFEAAILPLQITCDTPSCILDYFSATSSTCILPINLADFVNSYSQAVQEGEVKAAATLFANAESVLLNSAQVIPLCFEKNFFVSQKNVSGFEIDTSGAILFKSVIKK